MVLVRRSSVVRPSGTLAARLVLVVSLFALTVSAAPPAGATASATGTKPVAFGPVRFDVPSAWPVVDLTAHPARCARFDRHAVYLGTQGTDARCPARAVGRADSVQIQGLTSADAAEPLGPPLATDTGLTYRPELGTDAARVIAAQFPSVGLRVTAAYATDPSAAERIVASFGLSKPSGASAGAPQPPAPPATPIAGPTTPSLQGYGGAIFGGLGVDTCAAPSETYLRAWLASPYRMLGIYIGGANRGCSQPNMTPTWIADVEAMGWRYIPTYVGLQAPCAKQQAFAKIDPAQAAIQGKAAADDASTEVTALGLGQGAPVYFDMEGYDSSDTACDATVETFLSAFVGEMHVKHLTAGVYGSASTTIAQLAAHYNDKGAHRPDDVWIGHWDNRQDVFGDPYIPDDLWPTHQRLHQYQGQHYETWGGVQIFVDNDIADGAVVGPRRDLVFAGPGGGPREIFAVGPDGIGLSQLTHNTVDDYAPALSPDGTKIAYTSNAGGNYDLWVMDADGTGARKVGSGATFDGYPSWSPTGGQIVFQSNRTGRENLWIVGADGTGLRRLTSVSTADDVRPAWSPGGATVAFHSDRSGNNDVWTVATNGTGLRRLTWRTGADQDPSWARNGSLIAFESDRTGNFEIFTISPKGTGATQVSDDPASDNGATWSPDSARIVFTSDRTGTTQVFVMDRTGTNVIQLTFAGSTNQLPSWAS
jgi:hypothetical protein